MVDNLTDDDFIEEIEKEVDISKYEDERQMKEQAAIARKLVGGDANES